METTAKRLANDNDCKKHSGIKAVCHRNIGLIGKILCVKFDVLLHLVVERWSYWSSRFALTERSGFVQIYAELRASMAFPCSSNSKKDEIVQF